MLGTAILIAEMAIKARQVMYYATFLLKQCLCSQDVSWYDHCMWNCTVPAMLLPLAGSCQGVQQSACHAEMASSLVFYADFQHQLIPE